MRTITYICLCCLSLSAGAEPRTWTLKDGTALKGDFLSLVGKKVSIRDRTQTHRFPLDSFLDKDVRFIELQTPPRLDLNFTKLREQKHYPVPLWGDRRPQCHRYSFSVSIKQTSTRQYAHELTAELFVIGREVNGNKRILLDRQMQTFSLEGYNSEFTLSGSRDVELLTYVIGGSTYAREQGREYAGYLAIVTDSRGEIIAHRSTSKNLFKNMENLEKLPVGAFFDKTCTRSSPTRPDPFGN